MYLMVAGGIMTTFFILSIIAGCTPCKGDDKVVNCLAPCVGLAMLSVIIWGSVVVFGKLNKYLSMTILLTHTVAHSTKPSPRPKTNNQPPKKFLSLALS